MESMTGVRACLGQPVRKEFKMLVIAGRSALAGADQLAWADQTGQAHRWRGRARSRHMAGESLLQMTVVPSSGTETSCVQVRSRWPCHCRLRRMAGGRARRVTDAASSHPAPAARRRDRSRRPQKTHGRLSGRFVSACRTTRFGGPAACRSECGVRRRTSRQAVLEDVAVRCVGTGIGCGGTAWLRRERDGADGRFEQAPR